MNLTQLSRPCSHFGITIFEQGGKRGIPLYHTWHIANSNTLYHITSHSIMSYHTALHSITSHPILPYSIVSYPILSYHITPHHIKSTVIIIKYCYWSTICFLYIIFFGNTVLQNSFQIFFAIYEVYTALNDCLESICCLSWVHFDSKCRLWKVGFVWASFWIISYSKFYIPKLLKVF